MDSESKCPALDELVLGLARIVDIRQRSYALAGRLAGFESDVAVDTLKTIRENALAGDEDCLLLYNALTVTGVLADVLGKAKISALVEAAQSRADYETVALLVDIPQQAQDEVPFQPFLDASLKETSLGMRKALARKPDFKLISRIAHDQDYRVIEILLNNPRLTERDVIRIGATRPTSPKVLEKIFNHRKWISRYAVKKVIVLNPHAPLSMALKLLTFMRLEDLNDIVSRPDLNSALVREAVRLAAKKGFYR
jgi:hypothetical protein